MDSGDPLLDDLTADQRDAVTTRADPLCIVAGAGSGKTRVLTRRIAWQADQGHLDARRTLALTFTRRAASELRDRLRRLGMRDGVAAGTFHAVALAHLRQRCVDEGRRLPELLDSRLRLLRKILPDDTRPSAADFANEIGWARARLITPERYVEQAAAFGRRPPRSAETTASVYADYEKAKRSRRVIDFDDLLAMSHSLATNDPEAARVFHWRHRHLFVDEFQDVNPLQFALLKSWLGPETSLVVVGDPDQAIYGWNGADPDLIRQVDRHLEGCAVVRLRTNFRSTPEILAVAGHVLEREPQPGVRDRGTVPTVAAVDDEAVHVARAVRARHRPGGSWRRQAVLARTNAQLAPIREALGRSGVPVAARGDTNLANHPAVVDLIGRWEPRVSLANVIVDDETPIEPVEAVAHDTIHALATFHEIARDHLALDPEATLGSFMTALRIDSRSDSPTDGVELATFHGAKGLEWPVVHLIGLESGTVPISQARTPEALAEERRLLHVAVTRAEQELHATWARQREVRGVTREREPSPWLTAFSPAEESDAVPSTAALASVRSQLDHSTPTRTSPDGASLRAALDQWRAARARQVRVEPTAVLSDEVVDAIVALRPDSPESLRRAGVGAGHVHRWGDELLSLVRADFEVGLTVSVPTDTPTPARGLASREREGETGRAS